MALEDIKKTIIFEAEAEAKKIEAEGEIKAAEINNDWKKKIDEKKLEIIASAKRKAGQKIQQTQFKLQSKGQAEILGRKQEIIERAYKNALKKMADFKDDEYVKLMEKLINNLPEIEGDLFSVKEKENLLKKALKNSGKKYGIGKKSVSGVGGFVFNSSQMEINNTFSALINNSKEQTILEVAGLLFMQAYEK